MGVHRSPPPSNGTVPVSSRGASSRRKGGGSGRDDGGLRPALRGPLRYVVALAVLGTVVNAVLLLSWLRTEDPVPPPPPQFEQQPTVRVPQPPPASGAHSAASAGVVASAVSPPPSAAAAAAAAAAPHANNVWNDGGADVGWGAPSSVAASTGHAGTGTRGAASALRGRGGAVPDPAPLPLPSPPAANPPSVPIPPRTQPLAPLPAVVLTPSTADGTPDTSSLTAFVSSGGALPILVVTCNRAALLRKTLTSLLSTRGVRRENIFVVQDGAAQEVEQVIHDFGLRYHQKTASVRLRGGRPPDGAQRIASHYKYSLSYMFDVVTSAPGVIVVEDDFLFAPDFYEYFHAVAPVVEEEPSLWLASAWNDNGFAGTSRDVAALRRTSYFPGLGWMLPRQLYKDELEGKWPSTHWDHWMRDKRQHKDRDIIIPEMPRDYHIGVKGTFMDQGTHNKYFKDIAVNMDVGFRWDSQEALDSIASIRHDAYTAQLRSAVAGAVQLTSVQAIESFTTGTGVVWYSTGVKPVPFERNEFRFMAAYFAVWHEGVRGSRDGVHVVKWLGDAVVHLVNVRANTALLDLKPGGKGILSPMLFKRATKPAELSKGNARDPTEVLAGQVPAEWPPMTAGGWAASAVQPVVVSTDGQSLPAAKQLPASATVAAPPTAKYRVYAASDRAMSCHEVCAQRSLRCYAAALPTINTCQTMSEHFSCVACQNSYGRDQPAHLPGSKPPEFFDCAGKHAETQRLCPCLQPA